MSTAIQSPIVSVFHSAIRVHHWLRLHENLSSSQTPFEIVYAGHVSPDFVLPNNFKHIHTEACPAEAAHIAATNCSGQYMAILADDCVPSTAYLDRLLETCQSHRDKAIITPQWRKHLLLTVDRLKSDTTLLMPVGAFMSRKVWDKIGGIDNRFISLFWDLDITLRYYEMDGGVELCDTARLSELRAPNPIRRRGCPDENRLLIKAEDDYYTLMLFWPSKRKGFHRGIKRAVPSIINFQSTTPKAAADGEPQ